MHTGPDSPTAKETPSRITHFTEPVIALAVRLSGLQEHHQPRVVQHGQRDPLDPRARRWAGRQDEGLLFFALAGEGSLHVVGQDRVGNKGMGLLTRMDHERLEVFPLRDLPFDAAESGVSFQAQSASSVQDPLVRPRSTWPTPRQPPTSEP